MREIKFRAWCGKMLFPHGIFINGDRIRLMFYGEHEKNECLEYTSIPYNFKEPLFLMQYTGLKDKNGREIYDGDIVRADWHWETPHLIEWPDDLYDICEYCISDCLEVLGNIYENPELMEAK